MSKSAWFSWLAPLATLAVCGVLYPQDRSSSMFWWVSLGLVLGVIPLYFLDRIYKKKEG